MGRCGARLSITSWASEWHRKCTRHRSTPALTDSSISADRFRKSRSAPLQFSHCFPTHTATCKTLKPSRVKKPYLFWQEPPHFDKNIISCRRAARKRFEVHCSANCTAHSNVETGVGAATSARETRHRESMA